MEKTSKKYKDRERKQKRDAKTKNSKYCVASGRHKVAFETKEKARRFLQYLPADMENKPFRIYYCHTCYKYHTTSREYIQKANIHYKNT